MDISETKINSVVNNDIRWDCHLHYKSGCYVTIHNGCFHHVVPTKTLNQFANNSFNSGISDSDFSERLCHINESIPISPLVYTSLIKNESCFDSLSKIFSQFDNLNVIFKYERRDEPSSKKVNKLQDQADIMVKKHLVVTLNNTIIVCNKHLLNGNKSKKFKYDSDLWRYHILRALYPKVSPISKNISPDTPTWVSKKLVAYQQKRVKKHKLQS